MTAEAYEGAASRAVAVARKSRGMTQQQLADALGVARPRISELERGANAFRLRTLFKLAAALDVSPADLLVELMQ